MDIEHAEKLAEVDARSKSNTHRIDELEKRQDNLDELVGTVKVLAVREDAIEKSVASIDKKVDSLVEKPGKQWEDIKAKVAWAIIGAVIAFVMTHIGLQ